GLPAEEQAITGISLAEQFAREVAATGEPLAVADIRDDPRFRTPEFARPVSHISYLGLPLKLADRLIGVLVFSSPAPRTYAGDEGAFLAAFAQQAALALDNARLFDQEQVRRKQLEVVRTLSGEITRELDLTSLLALITRRAAGLLGVSSGTVLLWDEEAQLLVPQTWHGRGEWVKEVRLRLGEGVAGTVARRREGMIVNDYRTSSYVHPSFLELTRVTAVIAEPLLYRDRLLGVITLTNEPTGRPFTPQDRETLALFAAHAAIAIQNARLYAATQHELAERKRTEETLVDHTRQLEAVRAVTAEITRELDLITLLRLICQRPGELIGTETGAVWLWDEESQLLVPAAWHGYGEWRGEVRLRLGEGVAGTVARRREGMIVNDYRTSSYALPFFLERMEATAVLAEPLVCRDRLLGVITVDNKGLGRPFTEKDRELLTLFAAHAAIAIQNAQLYDAIRLELTERQRAEKVLRLTQERYRDLFEHAPMMYVITGDREGEPIILDCNELFLHTLGYRRAEVLGRPLADFYTPGSRRQLL
ncbi:MAG: GAF domain-containing protein, partial [candidate division NC10 bacterium]|nr:GAF domain-containing protein [candidate division NC10 bacterium]